MQNNNSSSSDGNVERICLVLDLDQTLLNSCLFSDLKSEEKYLLYSSSCHDDDDHHHPTDAISTSNLLYKLDSLELMTKLRPFVHSFLKEASELFELYIFSMADRNYCLEMAKLLDPESVYFNFRKVFSKADCSRNRGNVQKSLDVVFGSREDIAVLILDDREDVWRKEDKENLILVKGYHFFRSSCEQFGQTSKSLHQLRTDESETDGTLSAILRVLHQIHSCFLDHKKNGTSVGDQETMKLAVKTVRSQILKGCEIVITSGVSCRIKKMCTEELKNHAGQFLKGSSWYTIGGFKIHFISGKNSLNKTIQLIISIKIN